MGHRLAMLLSILHHVDAAIASLALRTRVRDFDVSEPVPSGVVRIDLQVKHFAFHTAAQIQCACVRFPAITLVTFLALDLLFRRIHDGERRPSIVTRGDLGDLSVCGVLELVDNVVRIWTFPHDHVAIENRASVFGCLLQTKQTSNKRTMSERYVGAWHCSPMPRNTAAHMYRMALSTNA